MTRRMWLDLGDFRDLVDPWIHAHSRWNDHGGGVLLTMARQAGIEFERESLRLMSSWGEFRSKAKDFSLLALNCRSYNYPMAKRAAQIFKQLNPDGKVVVGGMHATVAPEEMDAVPEFDVIASGAGENIFLDIIRDPAAFPRHVSGKSAASLNDFPWIDRTLWPKPDPRQTTGAWPLEPECGWGPGPIATLITSRVCPYQCSFCNENAFIASMGRRSVDSVIDELNYLDSTYGPLGSVVFHDSLFMQQPRWLAEFLDKYPRKAHRPWPFWAATRADLVRKWPDLFTALVRECNWHTVSIGFESGSDRVLQILNKETTAEDNLYAIELLNRLGDEMEAAGKTPPKFFSNIIFATPGETREDAFSTIRMLKATKRLIPSIAYYAPYPGGALGYAIAAEGKSLMSSDNYHRFPGQEKVKGIDYRFYADLLAGKYDREIAGAPMRALVAAQGTDGIETGVDKRNMVAHRPLVLEGALTKA